MQTSNAEWALKKLRRGATAPVFGWRSHPELVTLAPRPGASPSDKPPVRIFVGTEPAQDRIERVLTWSIEQVRDPGRTYEIYLMKELAGFDQRHWITGFTNYRFAIPHMAGGTGRAIYNDCDQVYLADPALLFDLDMGPHGFMSINDHDTSVMLIDCERMSRVWSLDDARFGKRKRIEAKARAIPDLWGKIDAGWNARDEEYVAQSAKCVHFTTLHTQPWLPFPERFVYHRNPIAHVFEDLERSADAAGFSVFSRETPSSEYRALVSQLQVARTYEANGSTSVLATATAAPLCELEATSTSVLEFYFAAPPAAPAPDSGEVTRFDPTRSGTARVGGKEFESVVCRSGLEFVPSQDVPWLLDWLFQLAGKHLHIAVRINPATIHLPGGTSLASRPRGEVWWHDRLQSAGQRRPEIRWRLDLVDETAAARRRRRFYEGGRLPETPRVWVLADDKTGHTVQSVGLADALGWPCEVKRLDFNLLNRLSNHLLGDSAMAVRRASAAGLTAPWPDLVISTGRRTAPVARWIARKNGGHTRLVHLGRKGGEVADDFDLVVSCAHFRMPRHRNRIELAAPLNTLDPATVATARERWQPIFAGAPQPRVTLVIGGSTAIHQFSPEIAAKMASEVRAAVEAVGGKVFAITSPRTGEAATDAIAAALGDAHHLHRWRADETDNPYFGFLALGDALVVTGESESMLSEACSIGSPVYIYAIPEISVGRRQQMREWVAQRAYSRPRKKNKGTVRPQQGLEGFCARLIAGGWVRPPRDMKELHQALVRSGAARIFGSQPIAIERHRGLREVDDVAQRVRAMFGLAFAPEHNA